MEIKAEVSKVITIFIIVGVFILGSYVFVVFNKLYDSTEKYCEENGYEYLAMKYVGKKGYKCCKESLHESGIGKKEICSGNVMLKNYDEEVENDI